MNMLVFIFKVMIVAFLHLAWLLTTIVSGYVSEPDFLDIGNTDGLFFINALVNMLFYQVYVYLTYKICKNKKMIYNVIYWCLNIVGLIVELRFLVFPVLF